MFQGAGRHCAPFGVVHICRPSPSCFPYPLCIGNLLSLSCALESSVGILLIRRRAARRDTVFWRSCQNRAHAWRRYRCAFSFFLPVYRVGEALHPGPFPLWACDPSFRLQSIYGDGQCLYGALGAAFGFSAGEMRALLLEHARLCTEVFSDIDPSGDLQTRTLQELEDQTEWGGGAQILVASHKWATAIAVHSPAFPTVTFGPGAPSVHLA